MKSTKYYGAASYNKNSYYKNLGINRYSNLPEESGTKKRDMDATWAYMEKAREDCDFIFNPKGGEIKVVEETAVESESGIKTEVNDMSDINQTAAVADTSEQKRMNIYEKIQLAKRKLSERELKKSGYNKFSDYAYYELSDFMPSVIEIFDELKLFSKIVFLTETAMLIIIDSEKPDEREEYTSPIKDVAIKGANAVQMLGGAQTYLRRYLYMAALDITEPDNFDAGTETSENGKGKSNIPEQHKQQASNKPPEQPKSQPSGVKYECEECGRPFGDKVHDGKKIYGCGLI